VIILDTLLIGGLRFVLGRIAAAVDAEMDDDRVWREELLAAQMRLELGEIEQDEFDRLESDLLARLREIRERRQGEPALSPKDYKVTGIEASFGGDEHDSSSLRR
jgi:hypothetical protein